MAKPTRLTQEMIDENMARGFWDGSGIADILERNARFYPGEEALVDSRTRLTWSGLQEAACSMAAGLIQRGLQRDQALVAQMPTSALTLVLLLACHRAGILCCFPPMTCLLYTSDAADE